MSAPAAFGIVITASAVLRREPRHASELRSQLLLGETVRILGSRDRGQWLRVRSRVDGYAGWTRAWSIRKVGAVSLARWEAAARARVTATVGTLRTHGPGQDTRMPAFLGSRVRLVRRAGASAVVELPAGGFARLPARSVATPGRPGIPLRRRVRSLMGVPYLWGGRTPAGFDCSGFTQIVLAEQGTEIPRDAHLQFREARPIATGDTPRLGDLVFFGRPRERVSHVGIMLDACTFVHCRGWVRIASVDPSNPLCEKELLRQFRGIRRPFSRPSGRPIRTPRGGESP